MSILYFGQNIHLLCVTKYEMVKKYGFEEILKPILECIQEFEKVWRIHGVGINQDICTFVLHPGRGCDV